MGSDVKISGQPPGAQPNEGTPLQDVQFAAVAGGAKPDLSQLGDEEALALLMMQRTHLINTYLAGVEKEQLQMNNAANGVQNALGKLHEMVDDPAQSVQNALKNLPGTNAADYSTYSNTYPPSGDDYVTMSQEAFNTLMLQMGGLYKGIANKVSWFALRDKAGKLQLFKQDDWNNLQLQTRSDRDSVVADAYLSSYADDFPPGKLAIYFRSGGKVEKLIDIKNTSRDDLETLLHSWYTSGVLRHPVTPQFDEDKLKSGVADEIVIKRTDLNDLLESVKGKPLEPPYFSEDLLDPNTVKGLNTLGLKFPYASASDVGVKKLISQVQNKQSQINQNLQDMTRDVTKNTYYVNQDTEMASTTEMNHALLIHNFINDLNY